MKISKKNKNSLRSGGREYFFYQKKFLGINDQLMELDGATGVKPVDGKFIDASYIANLNIILEGENYRYIDADKTPLENGNRLVTTYNAAKTATPNGLPLSIDNPINILVSPGKYQFDNTFRLDTSYINIKCLTNEAEIYLVGSSGIYIEDDIVTHLKGVDARGLTMANGQEINLLVMNPNTIIENCYANSNSFGYSTTDAIILSGTFKNVTSGDNSFGRSTSGSVYLHGKYEDITSGDYSLGCSDSGYVDIAGVIRNLNIGSLCVGITDNGLVRLHSFIENVICRFKCFGVSMNGNVEVHCHAKNVMVILGGGCFGSSIGGNVTLQNVVLENIILINVKGGDSSFGYSSSGTVVINNSKFKNCKTSKLNFCNSFGYSGSNTVTIENTIVENCWGGSSCFGVGGLDVLISYTTVIGTEFVSCCISSNGNVLNTAKFRDCKILEFSPSNNFNGELVNCILEAGSLSSGYMYGRIINCVFELGTGIFPDPVGKCQGVTIVNPGTGYNTGEILTVVGGTGVPATLHVDMAVGGAILQISIISGGAYTEKPINPVLTTGSSINDALFDLSNWEEGCVVQCVNGDNTISTKYVV